MTPQLVGVWSGRLYHRMARVLEASARHWAPAWTITIDELAFGGDGAAKLSAWLEAVEAAPAGTPILLTDVDAMITGPLDDLWTAPFDLAYTARDPARSPYPYNSGVIAVRASAGVAAFLYAWMIETRRLVAFPKESATRRELRHIYGAAEQGAFHTVLTSPIGVALQTVALPCRVWNCEDSEWARFDPAATRLVHTKGAFRDMIAGKPIMRARERQIGALWKIWQRWERLAKDRAATGDPEPDAPIYSRAWQRSRRWTLAQSARCLDRAVAQLGRPDSLLDVGCGWGHLVRRARTAGVSEAVGVDISIAPEGETLDVGLAGGGALQYADLTAPLDLGRTFARVLCWEVAEHLPPSAADVLVETLVRHLAPGGVLLFTAATPGQGGKGHLNEAPRSYWREKFARAGLGLDRPATVALAKAWRTAAPDAPWYAENIQVLRWADTLPRAVDAADLPTLALTMRTADRTPRANYLGGTLRRLAAQGVDLETVAVCLTHPDDRWIAAETRDLGPIGLRRPDRKRSPNENGLAQVEAGLATDAAWIALLEDDLTFCADFVPSVRRWLRDHARADRHVYRVFGFTVPPHRDARAYDWPLEKLRGSQAIMLRRADAADFLDWGRANLKTWCIETRWRTSGANPLIAFDKFVAAWALARWPRTPGVISHPYFVKHIGDQSSIHARGVRNDAPFAGEAWAYAPPGAEDAHV